jgi:GTP-binding protein
VNDLLRRATYDHPPTAVHKGAHLRIYYGTQPQANPPVFLFFANNAELVHWGYGRYLENRIREKYGFTGTPIKIVFRSREDRDPRAKRPVRSPKQEREALADRVQEFVIGEDDLDDLPDDFDSDEEG